MQDSLTNSENQTCNHCGSSDLFTEEKPPHLGLYCRDCGKWIKWLPRSSPFDVAKKYLEKAELRPQPGVAEAIRWDFTPSPDLAARVERLETEIIKINRELSVYARIFGANSRRPRQEFYREITDEQIRVFNWGVGGEG